MGNGLLSALDECILGCDESIRNEMLQNIVFCGGNTMFDGIVDRMYNEMECVPKLFKSKYLIDGFFRKCMDGKAMYDDIQTLTHKYCQGMNDPHKWMYTANGDDKVCITAPPERKYSAWIGGSILCS